MAHFFKKKFARSKSIWKKYSSMNTSAYFPSRRSASREAVAIRAKISAATIHKRGNVIWTRQLESRPVDVSQTAQTRWPQSARAMEKR